MKQFLVFLLSLILLVSCNNNISTIKDYSDYLNSKDVEVFEFLENKVDERITKKSTFSASKNIEITSKYSVIVFDCEKYDSLINLKILDLTYELLESDNNIIVMFINASNFDFLNGSKYSIPTNKTYIYYVQNFCYGKYITTANGEINDNGDRYNTSVISTVYDIIVEHEKLL